MKTLSAKSALRAFTSLTSLLSAAFFVGCSDGSSPTGPTPPPGDTSFVASGQISVPAGSLHTRLTTGANTSNSLGATTGRILEVMLQDTSGSLGTCDARCPSIDWSDGNGAFANQLTVNTSAGPQTFFLTENRGLSGTPDNPNPM